MRDEHLIYTDLPNDRIKIVPEEGYKMMYLITKDFMSEAITVSSKIKFFVSVEE